MKWTTADMPSLKGKVAIVTGANSGLGLHTTAGLAGAGATVVMACRSADKAAAALAEVKAKAPGAQVEVMPLDLADLASVRKFAADFSAKYPRLDILCNNAGVMAVPYAKTKDGFEMQVGTNHFGHFALTGLLLDKLKATPGSRVVSVASMAHNWTRGMDLDDPFFEHKKYDKWDAYGKSKLANLLFTFELNRRLKKAGVAVTAAAAHPGYSETNLGFVGPQIEKSALGKLVMQAGNALFAQPASIGALPTLYAASMADMAGGDYIGPDGFKQMRGYPTKVGTRRLAQDEKLQNRWWVLSERLTGVSYL
jgi:NAD(P)-dependent dehydrogenase (short-subunit alcohol dehydrogenase family)